MRAVAACVLGLASIAPGGEHEGAAEVFDYRLREPVAGRLALRVTARTDGTCDVVFREATTQVKLTADDFRTFEDLLAEASLPGESAKDFPDAVVGSLRVTRDGSSRELRIVNGGRTKALSHWYMRVMREADGLLRLREGKDIDAVCAILDSRRKPGPGSVLHPSAFREPLERLLAIGDDANLRQVVGALSCVTTPEEWSRALDRRLNSGDDGRVDRLVYVLSGHFLDGQPSHQEARMKLLLDTLPREYPDPPGLETPRRMAATASIGALARERHKPAIPVFFAMLERHATVRSAWWWAMPELAPMRGDLLDHLAPLLASPEAGARMAAVQIAQLVLEWDLRRGRHGRSMLSEEEQEAILKRMREEFAPRIRGMAEGDPEPAVRKKAANALSRIEKGWAKR